MYRLFSVEHSIFSAKVRSYLRFKQDQKDLGTGPQDPQLVADAIALAACDPSSPFRIPVGDDAAMLFGAQKQRSRSKNLRRPSALGLTGIPRVVAAPIVRQYYTLV